MTITSAVYWSRDNYRIKYVEDGETKLTKQGRPEYDKVLAAVTPAPYVHPKLKYENKEPQVMGEFWRRAASHYGVTVERAKAHVAVNGANATIQALFTKATSLLDDTGATGPDTTDDTRW